MSTIGLIGEDPYDTESIKNLLAKKYKQNVTFKPLIRNKRGCQLDNPRTLKALRIEYDDHKPNYVLFIRDADGIKSDIDKIAKVSRWFDRLNRIVNDNGILLVNIYELEALILADINTFNKLYGTKIRYTKNVMFQRKPKEFLIEKTIKGHKIYCTSHCPDIFKSLDFDMLIERCEYFKEFHYEFSTKIGASNSHN